MSGWLNVLILVSGVVLMWLGARLGWRVGRSYRTYGLIDLPSRDDLRFTSQGVATIACLTAVFIPPVGFVAGAALLRSGKPVGRRVLYFSGAMVAVWVVAGFIVALQ